ncbi:Nudix family hydrolase [Niveibacterium sp. 24ML]|uniref:Nudix family hydrolase n=1 Tax=Niveibacterium sp. 24ML TaxID=2985512 RepID=UPI00226E2AB8|nr:Nudix family hydrolase [Niveibacterium sp. 24ML]MCX9155870.1 Nudix family hydrolase [Niveibacterium sp. 24ML]
MRKRVEVAAAVITRPDGSFLLGQRAPDTFYAGYWEFPGGKVEAGESAHAALVRELQEELGITVHRAHPWITREHLYEHAHVRLHFFEVCDWSGTPNDHVHSALEWQQGDAPSVSPMLPANGPILKSLRLPRTMGITHAAEIGVDAQLTALDATLGAGLRLVQIRDANLAADARTQLARETVARCHAHGAIAVVNGDAALAAAVSANGLHLRAGQLAGLTARPDFEWVGASCHTRADLETAARLELDYALLGPVLPTATHPGASGIGWGAFHMLSRDLPMPVFAIGGLRAADMDTARGYGAHGIAAIRSVWGPGKA